MKFYIKFQDECQAEYYEVYARDSSDAHDIIIEHFNTIEKHWTSLTTMSPKDMYKMEIMEIIGEPTDEDKFDIFLEQIYKIRTEI